MGLPACAKALDWTSALKNGSAKTRTEDHQVEPPEGTEVLLFSSLIISLMDEVSAKRRRRWLLKAQWLERSDNPGHRCK
jgi:hypothetical protein